MMKQKKPLLNKYLQPLGSPIDDTPQQKYVPWQWGVKQGVQLKKIRSSTGYFKKLSAGAIGSVTSITGGSINTSSINASTITNSNFQGTISQPVEMGGTFTNPTILSSTISTSVFNTGTLGTAFSKGGTFNNAVLGTPSLTGGTVNSILQATGTMGTSGTITYLKTTAPTFGTISVSNGLIIDFN